jgi:hypothetical protein
MQLKDTPVPLSRCPYCEAPLDEASGVYERGPEPGDYSVCLICASLLRFDDAMQLRVPSRADLDELPPDFLAELRTYQQIVRDIDRRDLPSQHSKPDIAARHKKSGPRGEVAQKDERR